MNRLDTTFLHLQQQGRKALIPYLMAGYPGACTTPALMHVTVEAGADVIELGVPFSDPSADGPTIQAASEEALRQGIGLPQVLYHVRRFRESDSATPVVLMGYANPIERYDLLRQPGAFAADAAAAGVDGVLVFSFVRRLPLPRADEGSTCAYGQALDKARGRKPRNEARPFSRGAALWAF